MLRMKASGSLLGLVLALASSVWPTRAVNETKPYGLACVTIVDPAKNLEAVSGKGIEPQPGHLLTVHLDANAAGEALVFALTRKESRLAHGWRPLIVPLKEWSECTVPPKNAKWEWTKAAEPFDVFVVFCPVGSKAVETVRKWALALQNPAANEKTLATQATSLREELRKLQTDDRLLARSPETGPASIAGTVRNVGEFPWRESAKKANFDANKPGIVVFTHVPGN